MKMKSILCGLLAAVFLCAAVPANALPSDLSVEDISGAPSYTNVGKESPDTGEKLVWNAAVLQQGQGAFTATEQGIQIDEENAVQFAFTGMAGRYTMTFLYDVVYGRSRDAELTVLINGKLPYKESAGITLKRRFADKDGKILQDVNGNDIRPEQIEVPFEQRGYLQSQLYDSAGLVTEPLTFDLKPGDTVTLHLTRETLILHEITLDPPVALPSYEEYKKQFPAADASTSLPVVEAELPTWKSDSVLTAVSDRTSPITSPYKGSKIALNMIGSNNWTSQGQTMAWTVTPEETGFYELRMRVRQNYSKGFYSARTLRINGEIPFAEAESLTFMYNRSWVLYTLPYKLYFEKGTTYELSLSYTIGAFAGMLGWAQQEVDRLNGVYSDLLMVMGSTPDTMRDYHLEKVVPGTLGQMEICQKSLKALSKEILSKTKFAGSDLAPLTKTAAQLAEFVKEPEEIARRLRYFKDNIASLNTWIIGAKQRPLDMDFIQLSAPSSEKAKGNATLWESAVHFVTLFFASFFEDYNALSGANGASDVTLKVWSTQGRDQAQVFNDIIRTGYGVEEAGKNVSVSLEVVAPDAILPSVAAGNGPDVLMHANMQMPVNYATRKAVVNLNTLASPEEIEEVLSRFRESAVVPFRFNGGLYGLPEQQTFSLMYLRTDILARLGIAEIPETWEDILAALPILQKKNMSFLMDTGTSVGSEVSQGMNTFAMFLYQRGGQFYKDDGARTDLDNEKAVDAFTFWTRFYTNYGLPTNFDIANRFRTGEAPIVLSDVTLYNQLNVSAPEIKGLWKIAPVPGTKKEDGSIDRTVGSSVSASMIFETSAHKEEAWNFIKWWTSAKTQKSFANGMESLLGASARYPTANKEALEHLPWSKRDFDIISAQADWAVGVEEVPGGYYTARHINNAFRSVVIETPGREGAEPREAILQYSKIINDELSEKRREFGLE